jgi:hypothetical protein
MATALSTANPDLASAGQQDNEVTIFGRLIESGNVKLSATTARYILSLDFQKGERERMHELALKAQEGTLSPREEVEIDSYERVGHLLSIWKSKARKALKQTRRGTR